MDRPATKDPHSSKPKESLDLSYSNLVAVPNLDVFKHMHTLRLDNNDIEEVSWAALMGLAALTHVNLAHNRISTVPLEVARWTSIKVLDLSHNRITSVEPGLWPLFYLYDRKVILRHRHDGHLYLDFTSLEFSREMTEKFGEKMPETIAHTWSERIPNHLRMHFNNVQVRVIDEGYRYHREGRPGQSHKPRVLLQGNPVMLTMPRLETDWEDLSEDWRSAFEESESGGSDSDGGVTSDKRKERREDTRTARRQQRLESREARLRRDDKAH